MASDEQEKIRKELGEKLRRIRSAANLTQLDVANKSGMHVNYYARIERGEENPSFEKLQSIMKVLNIKSLDLLN
jgi:transcriptional regulator with XRE-family HTH domain